MMANSADPDQLVSSEANWSGSTLFAKQDISGFSRTRIKPRRAKGKAYDHAPTHLLKLHEEAVIESEARTAVVEGWAQN